ncbi:MULTISPECIES: Lrp/AsnC family transcriptional regulator [unclassified Clostridium]|uniref:Lrp/AsnC family transcriptional regulator n=1 Tax=unclassified Clostridium TaxID=2614128 RepID=UPI00023AF8B6|nr:MULTISPECIES: Lrp/AsnC family transcriptional regulator [unclassified Clostridium]EHI97481.1 transcriptional regulator, AsnC family [Clostridium sp. DL-VIII]OOM75569.1 leucine-responsive regulatory protein [Clostridium sp. BL-8]
MDKMDYKILKCLKLNARTKASAISNEIHLSVSAVIERIRKMEKNKVIKNYTIIVDQKKLGSDVTALMEISLEHPKFYEAFTTAIKHNNNIVSCYYLTGDFDFMIKILCKSSDDLEKIHRQIKSLEGVSSTKTHFVLKNVKNELTSIPDEED